MTLAQLMQEPTTVELDNRIRSTKTVGAGDESSFIGQTDSVSPISPLKVRQAHKVVLVLAKSGKVMHWSDIATRTKIPLKSVGVVLMKLKRSQIVVSPSWGYYSLANDFLRHFRLAYGNPKTDTLMQLFDESGVDVAALETSSADTDSATLRVTILETIKDYVNTQQKRIDAIDSEIQKLTQEKSYIDDELAELRKLALFEQLSLNSI